MAVLVVSVLVYLAEVAGFGVGGNAAVASPLEQAIIGGESSAPGEYAATGALVRGRTYTCTGTLIAPDVVVTAAHCLVQEGWGGLSFTLDADLTDGIDDLVPVSLTHQHPDFHLVGDDYTEIAKRNDVGVVILEEPFEGVPVEEVDARSYISDGRSSAELTLCGYGRDYWSMPSTAGVKRDGTVHVEVGNGWELQSTDENPQPCKGDSGGPLFVKTGEGRLVTAVVSRASGASQMCDSGAIYTRTAPYFDWIMAASADRDTGCEAGGTSSGLWPALFGWWLLWNGRRGRRRPARFDRAH